MDVDGKGALLVMYGITNSTNVSAIRLASLLRFRTTKGVTADALTLKSVLLGIFGMIKYVIVSAIKNALLFRFSIKGVTVFALTLKSALLAMYGMIKFVIVYAIRFASLLRS